MSRNISLYLQDILDAIDKIQSYTENQTLDSLLQNPLLADALTLNLLVIGEAAGKIPMESRAAYPQIPWRQIVGLRNVISHQYFNLDIEIVWDVVEQELSDLREVIQKLLAESKW